MGQLNSDQYYYLIAVHCMKYLLFYTILLFLSSHIVTII